MESLVDALQWPAMLATLIAAWLVASQRKHARIWGFGWFVLSNFLWVIWGWSTHAWALIVLQVGLFVLNLRGLRKNESDTS